MNRFVAKVTVTLHFDDGRDPVVSKKQTIEFEADADDADEAWEEFLEGVAQGREVPAVVR